MPGHILNYTILRTLGSGVSCKVKLGFDTQTGKKVAVKIMNDKIDLKTQELVLTEVKAMSKLKHENIVNQIAWGKATYVKESGKEKEIVYIVLELANGGELFDFIAISGRFNESIARFYFKQLINGLNFCHQSGITHRDLKPENILLDSNYTLKIADFGFAAPV